MREQDKIQAVVDRMNADMQRTRAKTQLTLGALIKRLEARDPNTPTEGFGRLSSYRGHYCDLAFTPEDCKGTVGGLLEQCRSAMGRIFEGYKGGDFLMGETTPLWMSPYGTASGDRLVDLGGHGGPLMAVVAPAEE